MARDGTCIATQRRLNIPRVKFVRGGAGAIGIIGGADGPTATFVAVKPAFHALIGLACLVISLAVWLACRTGLRKR